MEQTVGWDSQNMKSEQLDQGIANQLSIGIDHQLV